MRTRFFRHTTALILAFTLATTCTFAQDSDKSKKKSSEKSSSKSLDDKNNPALIGKRDINKGSIQFYSIEREVAIGRQLAAEVDRSSKIINDPIVTEYINRVAQNVVLHSDSKVPFTIKVIDSQEVNAFALPGGFLYVNRGLLEAAENEAEVAGVIAHEIAHVAARHGMEQASKGELFNYLSIPLIFLGGIGGYAIRQGLGLAVPLSFLKFSRGAEKEADRLGAQYMWASGYDPNALITFFEKLQAKNKKKPGTLSKLFSTHPMTGDRITEVRELIAQFPERGEYQLSSSEFGQVKSRIVTIAGATRGSGRDESGRPTLKRKPQTTTDDDKGDSETSNRPVLKRRDDSQGGDQTGNPPQQDSQQQSETTGRPTLKRRPDSNN
ncbi:MAG TPA: M48 family metallopeptidase [Blastocatellia bacterium]|jgi:predicted Zn-dependent protease|nr:M48 family metallopeptidase [Blastocatellia bacterium]